MKLHSLFLALSLVATLNASEAFIEKYLELRNDSSIQKIEAYRNLVLQNRDNNQEVRDYKDILRENRIQALYARTERGYATHR